MTARSLETLIRLASAHAKARLSHKVEEADAAKAMDLMSFALYHETTASLDEQQDDNSGDRDILETSNKQQARHEKTRDRADDDTATPVRLVCHFKQMVLSNKLCVPDQLRLFIERLVLIESVLMAGAFCLVLLVYSCVGPKYDQGLALRWPKTFVQWR